MCRHRGAPQECHGNTFRLYTSLDVRPGHFKRKRFERGRRHVSAENVSRLAKQNPRLNKRQRRVRWLFGWLVVLLSFFRWTSSLLALNETPQYLYGLENVTVSPLWSLIREFGRIGDIFLSCVNCLFKLGSAINFRRELWFTQHSALHCRVALGRNHQGSRLYLRSSSFGSAPALSRR